MKPSYSSYRHCLLIFFVFRLGHSTHSEWIFFFYISSVHQLGQHYLILAEEEDRDLNNRLAVNWLIKAAKQGRKSAARALQRCWIRKIGYCANTYVCVWGGGGGRAGICIADLFGSGILTQESLQRIGKMFGNCRQRVSLRGQCVKQPWWCTGIWIRRRSRKWPWLRCWRMSARSTKVWVWATHMHSVQCYDMVDEMYRYPFSDRIQVQVP